MSVDAIVWWLLASCLLAVFLATPGSSATLPYSVVRLNAEGNNSVFLVSAKSAKLILDNETITSFGFDAANLVLISLESLAALRAGPPVGLIMATASNSDEAMRIAILKSAAINGANLVREAKFIGWYMNPAITKWQGRLLLASGRGANTMVFRWVNDTQHPFHASSFDNGQKFLGIDNEEAKELDEKVIVGQDPRLVVFDDQPDKLQIYFTNPYEAKHARMGCSELVLNKSTNSVQISKHFNVIHPTIDWNQPQKNWSPFVYGNEVLLIQTINPFVVMKFSTHDEAEITAHASTAYLESSSEVAPVHWPYGGLRGGSNAVLLKQKDLYLSFFHSHGHLPGNALSTYFIGAYTFTMSTPFRLVSISPIPIMPEQFYTGAWYTNTKAFTDYCLFASTLFLQSGKDGEDEDVLLSVGHNDLAGYLLRFKVEELLDTLVPVVPT